MIKLKVIKYIGILFLVGTIFMGCSSTKEKYLKLQNDFNNINNKYKISQIKDEIQVKKFQKYSLEYQQSGTRETSSPRGTGLYIANKQTVISKLDLYNLNNGKMFVNLDRLSKKYFSNTSEEKKATNKAWFTKDGNVGGNSDMISLIIYKILQEDSIRQDQVISLNFHSNNSNGIKQQQLTLQIKGLANIENKEYIVAKFQSNTLNRYKFTRQYNGYLFIDKETFLPTYISYKLLVTNKDKEHIGALSTREFKLLNSKVYEKYEELKTYSGQVNSTHCKNGRQNNYLVNIDKDLIFGTTNENTLYLIGKIQHKDTEIDKREYIIRGYTKNNKNPMREDFLERGDIEITSEQLKGNYGSVVNTKCQGDFTLIRVK